MAKETKNSINTTGNNNIVVQNSKDVSINIRDGDKGISSKKKKSVSPSDKPKDNYVLDWLTLPPDKNQTNRLEITFGKGISDQEKDLLTSLCSQIFVDCKNIFVSLFGKKGFSGADIYKVVGFKESGAEILPCVLKVAFLSNIEAEFANYKTHVQNVFYRVPLVYNNDIAKKGKHGGIAYSIVGDRGKDISSFADFYAENNSRDIASLFDKLQVLIKPWSEVIKNDYHSLFGETFAIKGERLGSIKHVSLELLQRYPALVNIINPVLWWEKKVAEENNFHKVRYTIVHGDMNLQNIIVEKGSITPWLIDFALTGEGYHLRDMAKLESEIRINLFKTDDASSDDFFKLDDYLKDGKMPEDKSSDSIKLFEVIKKIRSIAEKKGVEDDDYLYRLALLQRYLNNLAYNNIPMTMKADIYRLASYYADTL